MGGRAGLDFGDGRVSDGWARQVRQQVPRGVDHEISLQDLAGGSGGASAGADPADLPDAGGADRAGSGVGGPCAHAGVGAAALGPVEAGAVHQGEVVAAVAGRVPALAEAVLGPAPVGAGVFLRDGGRGGRAEGAGVHRRAEVGRGRGGLAGGSAGVALSRLQPGTSQAALAAPATFSRTRTHRLSVGGRSVKHFANP